MWSETYEKILSRLDHQPLCWVQVHATRGSVPREQGAWMAVFADEVLGTIGGGHLEWQAIAQAQQLLSQWRDAGGETPSNHVQRYALGPSLGQCCGGALELQFSFFESGQRHLLKPLLPVPSNCVALFGAGHVGHALVRILRSLPYRVIWVDSRDAVFPAEEQVGVLCEHSDPVQAAVDELPAQTQVLIMSFSHAEDLEIVAQCLKRQRERGDLPFVGLIGSKTKWATFSRRLRERGFTDEELAHITCPIGVPGITGKEPEVIAVAVAAQLLQQKLQTV
ncbi:MAG: xanthine dehydrogenase accessory protein XdhC [Comamonas sp.]|jgi:xanthine dehydrogenase accessory factor|uniref:xanthine dehydrogenase accessory protein XdhC n=1 Tax=Comamonas sp. TaxID=34028 RepID=UPI00282F2DAF|nr:xanthine dehydrogenase accessory protein XdhC [Comamonas sp.]MDR0217117.1 xanthine dehydrogenase accessory protein XdhC [Comamonas sp.]MDR2297613.1 xanthine dehydrogenase accessory protein XdhC [Comamonas sp.]